MKKLMIITLLSATAGSVWGAAKLESASNLATLQRSLASFGKSQQQLGDELTKSSLKATPEMEKQFIAALADKESADKKLQEREESAARRLQEFFKKNNPDMFWGVKEGVVLPAVTGGTVKVGDMGPLMIAVLTSRNTPLQLLLEHNFPLTRNDRNESAFHIAAARLDAKKLNMLLNKFVPDVKVHQGNDPRDWKNINNDTPYQVWLRIKERKKAAGAPLGIDDATIKDIEKKLQ